MKRLGEFCGAILHANCKQYICRLDFKYTTHKTEQFANQNILSVKRT